MKMLRILIGSCLVGSALFGCADDGTTDDGVGDDTDESTSESSGSESGSTDVETGSTDATESTGESTDSETTESTDSETNDTADDTSDTGEPIMCPGVFPEFDKSCSDDADCAVVVHTTDCCGNSVAWGLNLAEVEAFETAEAICDSQYPECECPTGPTIAEDGNEGWEPADFAVECTMGSCMSYVPG